AITSSRVAAKAICVVVFCGADPLTQSPSIVVPRRPAELSPWTFCIFGHEFSSRRTISSRRTPARFRGVERRERTADDRPDGSPSAALRPPASGSRTTHKGHDHRYRSRSPSLDRPWLAQEDTEGRGDPRRDGSESIGTSARSLGTPATREEAHGPPSARTRPGSKLGIHLDARTSARRTRQN